MASPGTRRPSATVLGRAVAPRLLKAAPGRSRGLFFAPLPPVISIRVLSGPRAAPASSAVPRGGSGPFAPCQHGEEAWHRQERSWHVLPRLKNTARGCPAELGRRFASVLVPSAETLKAQSPAGRPSVRARGVGLRTRAPVILAAGPALSSATAQHPDPLGEPPRCTGTGRGLPGSWRSARPPSDTRQQRDPSPPVGGTGPFRDVSRLRFGGPPREPVPAASPRGACGAQSCPNLLGAGRCPGCERLGASGGG